MDTVKFCPFCGLEDTVTIKSEKREHILHYLNESKVVKAEFYFYKCSNCDEQFTTTETDTLSLQNFKKK